MQILDPGHLFLCDILDYDGRNKVVNIVQYVKREGPKYPGNVGHNPGVTIQEMCRVQIARLQYVMNQSLIFKDYESAHEDELCIFDNRDIILRLERRAARRHGRVLELTYAEKQNIETLKTCSKCGHIKPELHTECAS